MIVTAPLSDVAGTNRGELKIYDYASSSWSQVFTETSFAGVNDSEECGKSAALSGDGTLIFVVCPNYNDYPGSNRGRVKIYKIQ